MKKIIINIAGGCLQTIRSNFPVKIDEIEIYDEDSEEILNEQFDITDEPIPNQQDIDNYWEDVIVKKYPYVIY